MAAKTYWTHCQGCGAAEVHFPTLKALKAWLECEGGLCDDCRQRKIEEARATRPDGLPWDHPDLCPQCKSALLRKQTGGKIDCPKCGFCLTCGLT